MEVYEIRSSFASMCLMSKEDDVKDKQAQESKEQQKIKKPSSINRKENDEEKGGNRGSNGISIAFFKKNC